ncbi:hypothetical protein BLA29_010800 [Euroglyphus maynei]|uniref:Uncharacterized protein n=1 Tax=Euroglyphus maynei TaxID=6958 RepID=A0A1Y3B2S5_EURMA|nr:hypothetical protein BLA29_010800 [Euroglyphus maynei]
MFADLFALTDKDLLHRSVMTISLHAFKSKSIPNSGARCSNENFRKKSAMVFGDFINLKQAISLDFSSISTLPNY